MAVGKIHRIGFPVALARKKPAGKCRYVLREFILARSRIYSRGETPIRCLNTLEKYKASLNPQREAMVCTLVWPFSISTKAWFRRTMFRYSHTP